MSEIKNETIVQEVEQSIEIKREISEFYVNKSANISVKVNVTKTDESSTFVRFDWYQFPASELASNVTNGGSFYNEIKNALWGKINEIDNMPETTDEEIMAKSKKKGHGWKLTLN